jgi:hypothetical protein
MFYVRIWGTENPRELVEQRNRTAVAIVDEDKFRCVWNELNYRIDICRVTKGSHIEHL